MQEVMRRIAMLKESQFITQDEARDLYRVVEVLNNEPILQSSELDIAPLITHFAAMQKRLREGKQIEAPDASLELDIKNHGVYDEALCIEKKNSSAVNCTITDVECRYLIGHIGALILGDRTE